MEIRRFALAVVALCLCASIGGAADWPQWRGPQRNGVSQESGLLQLWPESGPKLVWRVDDLGAAMDEHPVDVALDCISDARP